jgi:hypothetical protein
MSMRSPPFGRFAQTHCALPPPKYLPGDKSPGGLSPYRLFHCRPDLAHMLRSLRIDYNYKPTGSLHRKRLNDQQEKEHLNQDLGGNESVQSRESAGTFSLERALSSQRAVSIFVSGYAVS